MRTRSQVRKRRQQQVRQTSVESPNLEKPNNNQETFNPPIVTMDDNRTMAQLLEAPTEGYEDAIVVPEINANNFEIKHGLLNLVQNKQFFGHDKEDPHAHIRYFNKITSTMKFPNVPNSLNSRRGGNFLDEKCPRMFKKIIEEQIPKDSQFTKQILVASSASTSTSVSHPPDVLRTQRYGQEPLLLDKKNQSQAPAHRTPASVKAVEESCVTCGGAHSQGSIYQPQVNQPPTYQAPVYQASIPQTQGVSKTDFDSYVKANDAVMRNMQNQNQVLQNQGQNLQAQLNNLATSNQRVESMLSNFIKINTASTSGSGTLPGNTITNPKEDLKGITTRSGVAYQGPTIPSTSTSSSPPKVMNRDTEVTKDMMLPNNNGSTEDVQPPVIQVQSQNPTSKPVVDPVSTPMPDQRTSIPFPSRRNDERRRKKLNVQIEKFYEIFRDLSFEISFTDALTLMPKFASTLKTLIGNKEKLSEMARTPLNENCSAVILNKLPKKLGDPGRFLIPCEFSGINTCNALADLGASINLMPYFVWKDLSFPELTPTCMTLELADRLITEPIEHDKLEGSYNLDLAKTKTIPVAVRFIFLLSVASGVLSFIAAVSSYSSKESVRTSTGRVILFGTIPTTIPDTTPFVIPPTTHIDTTPIPTVSPTIPPSPDYTPASPDYSLASDTEFDPSEDPSSDYIPPLLATLPFLSSTDDSSDSDIPDTPPSPTHGTPFTDTTLSTQRSPAVSGALRRQVMILSLGQPIPHGRPYCYHLNGPVHMMTVRKRVGPLPTHRLAVRHSVDYSSSYHFSLDDSSSSSSSETSSDSSVDALSDSASSHSSSDHSLPTPSSGMRPSHHLCSLVSSIHRSSAAIFERPSRDSSSASPSHKRSRSPDASV
ncbi:hypothetical protein Tco_0727874 [Tanacetum coccineum]|uniref:Reverse transcriptase domain-containing protein n=1 Tax=Tanacetum coccineum TaxID=301880 RepID=A0ABQ4YMP2_9ASTR